MSGAVGEIEPAVERVRCVFVNSASAKLLRLEAAVVPNVGATMPCLGIAVKAGLVQLRGASLTLRSGFS